MSGEQKEHIDRVGLLSWLETLERDFDSLLLKGRSRFSEPAGWVGIWLVRSLIGTNYEKMPENSVNKILAFFSSRLQTWVTYIGLAGVLGVPYIPNLSNLQLTFWPSILVYGGALISLVMSLYANLSRMLSLSDPYFNSNAYKLFRKQEYYMFLPYFRDRYTFKTVNDWVKLLFKENDLQSVVDEHREIQRELKEMVAEYKKNLNESNRVLKKRETMVKLLDRKIELLQRLAKVNEDGFNAAISTIYRLRASDPLFNTSDLRVVTDFSLFELVGTQLIRHCEQGTTETPRIIDINDPAYAHYSSIKLVHGNNTIEYATSDREGRTVASYFIDLPSGRTLIYNFHYDSTVTDMYDIIEMKEMYRYIKGICLLLEERGFLGREGQHHDAN